MILILLMILTLVNDLVVGEGVEPSPFGSRPEFNAADSSTAGLP